MITAPTIAELKQHIAALRAAGRRIAFVPTMGNLHAGHRHLMEQARRHGDAVVASIYVNPLQFGPNEDFAAYPRTPDDDRRVLEAAGVDLLFTPGDDEIYPRGRAAQTIVEVPVLSDILCGAHRAGHFRGVTTVVNRLFNLVTPDAALFGKKDYQQLLLIRLMVSDLGMPVEIVGIDTVRDADGLALSSRNAYLSADERRAAPRLYAVLRELRDRITSTGAPPAGAEDRAKQALTEAGFRAEYVSVRRQQDLGEPGEGDKQLVILAAAWLGRARLIDNLEYEL
ncbi:MAG TPA: pantoate--beta-alanine ligase [Acidiferrobacterales bacterium]